MPQIFTSQRMHSLNRWLDVCVLQGITTSSGTSFFFIIFPPRETGNVIKRMWIIWNIKVKLVIAGKPNKFYLYAVQLKKIWHSAQMEKYYSFSFLVWQVVKNFFMFEAISWGLTGLFEINIFFFAFFFLYIISTQF